MEHRELIERVVQCVFEALDLALEDWGIPEEDRETFKLRFQGHLNTSVDAMMEKGGRA